MKLDINYKKLTNLRDVFFYTVIIIFNSLSTYNEIFGISIALIGVIILLIYFINGNLKGYIKIFLLLLFSSIEVSRFAFGFEIETTYVYNFMRLPLINMYHFYLLMIIPLVMILRSNGIALFMSRIKKYKSLRRIVKFTFLTLLFGFITSLFTILFNDNNISNLNVFGEMLKNDIIMFGALFLICFYLSYLFTNDENNILYFEKFLVNYLFGLTVSTMITYIFGLHGYYGYSYNSEEVLLLPLAAFFSIMLLIFPFYSEYKNRIHYYVIGIIILIVMIEYPSPLGGKWWIIVISIQFIIGYRYVKSLTVSKVFKPYVFLILIVILCIFIFNDYVLFSNDVINSLSSIKLDQAISTLNISRPNWYQGLPDSPKFRFDEFINVLMEYKEKPIYLFFGKGLGGSLVQHTNTLNWNNLSAFSEKEIMAGVYFKLHESINIVFLKFGLFGLTMLITIIMNSLSKIKNNPWIAIGIFWLLFFYGGYFSMYFGFIALILGIIKVEANDSLGKRI